MKLRHTGWSDLFCTNEWGFSVRQTGCASAFILKAQIGQIKVTLHNKSDFPDGAYRHTGEIDCGGKV